MTYTKEQLAEILRLHALYLQGSLEGKKAYLQGANLSGANLQGANLQGANLRWANLREANLQEAYLRWANLQGADLQGADLRWANLREADLQEAYLQRAYLPSPAMVLMANWGEVSDQLTTDLMRLDASAHPTGGKTFSSWAKGGACPYTNCNVQRQANFSEKRDLWKSGRAPRLYDLMDRVLKEKCKGWNSSKDK